MIVVPLGAHLNVFSVLPRLRSVILTSLPPLSCQSPFAEVETADSSPAGGVSPRCKEQKHTGLPYISYSRKTKLVLHERASSGLFFFAIEFISRLVFSVFVCHRCHIAFLRRDIISLGGRVA